MIDRSEGACNLLICPTRLVKVLVVASVVICVLGAVAHVLRHQVIVDLEHPLADILRRFDIVEEPSLSQWFSSSLHLAAACLTAFIGVSLGRSMQRHWLGLSVIFAFASIDEAIMVHEMMDRPVRELFNTSGFLFIAWIIPGAFIALSIAICYFSFLRQLPRKTANWFVLGGAVFLCGSILIEIPGGLLYERYGFSSWHYIASYAVEEVMEMLGISIFIFGLVTHVIALSCTESAAASRQVFRFKISVEAIEA